MNNTNTFKEIKTLERLFRANDFLVEYGNPCHMVALCGYISYACALHPAKEGSSVFLWVSKGEGYRKIIFLTVVNREMLLLFSKLLYFSGIMEQTGISGLKAQWFP